MAGELPRTKRRYPAHFEGVAEVSTLCHSASISLLAAQIASRTLCWED